MDERTDPSAAFALRLVADLFVALVLEGVLPKKHAAALLESHPEHEQALREIAATVTVQTGLGSVEIDRRLGRKPRK